MNVETRISYIEQLENKIIRVEIKPDIQLVPEDLDENFNIYKKILNDEKGLFLIIFRPGAETNAQARIKFANEKRASIKIAEAFVFETLAHRIESNFYKRLYIPKHPAKIFKQEFEAIEWLLNLKL